MLTLEAIVFCTLTGQICHFMFKIDSVYNRRRDIHAMYGGNWQSGICPSRSHPFIFIFSGGKGHTHGYSDLWVSENIYAYTGEGQVGDMEFTRGNLALLNHLESGNRIFFFEAVGKGLVQYKSELELYDFDYQQGKDREQNDRQMIIFYFKKVGAQIQVEKPQKTYTHSAIETLVTEKETTIKSRVGQGAYRTSLIYRWNSKCAVSGVGKQELLIASHIKSWKDSDGYERTDINNGLLLNPNYDALFDKHLISFEDSGKIILTPNISDQDYNRLGVGISDRIHSLSSGNRSYLEHHRKQLGSR